MKKMDWSAFWFVILFAGIGGFSNYTRSILDCFILTAMFGIPIGMFFAWLGREKEKK